MLNIILIISIVILSILQSTSLILIYKSYKEHKRSVEDTNVEDEWTLAPVEEFRKRIDEIQQDLNYKSTEVITNEQEYIFERDVLKL